MYIQVYVQMKRQVNICTSEMCNKLVSFVFKAGMNTCNNGCTFMLCAKIQHYLTSMKLDLAKHCAQFCTILLIALYFNYIFIS